MIVERSIDTPTRKIESLSFEDRFGSLETGLITSWEIGRLLSKKSPELAAAALRGELPVLAWKGGVEKAIKLKEKAGALYYLAQWQGIRQEGLSIDTEREVSIVCSKTGVKVTFTNDPIKLNNS